MSDPHIPMPIEPSVEEKAAFEKEFMVGDVFVFEETTAEIVEMLDDGVKVQLARDKQIITIPHSDVRGWFESYQRIVCELGIVVGTKLKLSVGIVVTVKKILLENAIMVEYPNGKMKVLSGLEKGLDECGISIVSHPSENSAENLEQTKKFETFDVADCVFQEQEIKGMRGKKKKIFMSPRPQGASRKTIHLDENSPKPILGKSYRVQIIKDSDPHDVTRGKWIGRIIEEDILSDVPMAEPEIVEYKKVGGAVPPIELHKDQGYLIVGDVKIDFAKKRGLQTPSYEKFQDVYTLDERTIEVLQFIAEAVQLKQSCLLTGGTATSKTSAIEYLASLTGHEVIRLNLGGQTDTSELIGKYVPNDGQLQIQFEQLIQHPEQLSESSQTIVFNLQKEIEQTGLYRGLNKWESQQIAKFEALEIPAWRWQDGKIPIAMKTGAWIILDEINFADPSVRERLNSVLEIPPSIVITEHEGERISVLSDEEKKLQGSSDAIFEVKEDFRIFGTQNYAEDGGGRKVMSPAEKRRWSMRKNIDNPNAEQYYDNLIFAVYGEQPDIFHAVGGRSVMKYRGDKTNRSLFPALREMPKMREFLHVMAFFHEKIAEMARHRDIGRGKKEPEIFTRACLISFMDYLCNIRLLDRSFRPPKPISFKDDPAKFIERALEIFYLGKMTSDDDRNKVIVQLQVAGILDLAGKNLKFSFVE